MLPPQLVSRCGGPGCAYMTSASNCPGQSGQPAMGRQRLTGSGWRLLSRAIAVQLASGLGLAPLAASAGKRRLMPHASSLHHQAGREAGELRRPA